MGTGWETEVAGCSRGNLNFGACQGKENHCEATKDKGTYFQEHNLQWSNKTLPHHAISIILMALKIAEADWEAENNYCMYYALKPWLPYT